MSVEDSSPCSPRANALTRPRKIWTPEEDATLKTLVARYGDARGPQGYWKDIAAALQDRTAKDCRKRWFHSLDPSLKKGRWTAQEDLILLSAYARMGPAWHDIALLIPGRKDDQCSKRYMDILSPKVKDRLSDWSPQEDKALREGVRSLGHRWSAISAKLPGRPPLTCRNRWRALSKTSKRSTITEASPSNPSNTSNSSNAPPTDSPALSLTSLLVAAGGNAGISNIIDASDLATSVVGIHGTGLDVDDFRFMDDPTSYDSILDQPLSSTTISPCLDLGHISEPLQHSYNEFTSDRSDGTSKAPRSTRPDIEVPKITKFSTVCHSGGSFQTPDATSETPVVPPDLVCSRLSPIQPLSTFADFNLQSLPANSPVNSGPPQQVVLHHHHHYHHHYHHHHHHYHDKEENGSWKQLESAAELESVQS
ncbi:Homeodomain-like protein [Colletotrichum godetiae]|uniref:Homeodomain-like protein n=1 Tax=Colletotrichum godetiae TaxID=1209918 RepID=A0AAJ0AJP1_9PEZI|nr:Homeodomain-like protein [Colletotrichum godetiae]KAK1673678.1 Homeodomain-like protein [Colletotrichum godetiae]